ncbi:hypothetical protein PHYPSEUDO_001454 [Phytophthora pseudosyringae]|uniref:Uncharacterized protein n=1 Tax=Phytophthora pseudosyringae TaxID=221518 RepID=A0A8T1W0P0_9STRA|nr:hypothetical protein PHYPSEUDO_001454 [Phytophthora pseudosyringae]
MDYYSDSSSVPSYPAMKPVRDSWPFYPIGRPTDKLIPHGQMPRRISDLLSRAQGQGQVTFGDAASALPDVPGLAVEGVGSVPVPLCQEVTEKLAKPGLKEQANVWMIFPHLVRTKNPAWATGVQTLAEISSQRLGFKDVVLQPMLSKVMVVGAGGRLDTQQDAEIRRSVATLVVVVPSEHTGGDWVVCEEETGKEFRYDMGKLSGGSAFKPQYVVYAAGASSSMEEVTSGYCLVMIYSLCLPLEMPFTARHRNRNLLRMELAEAVKQLKGGPNDVNADYQSCGKAETDEGSGRSGEQDEILALMLSKSLTQTEVESAGVNALSDVDRDRLQLLLDANKLLPPANQLIFYLARLGFGVPAFGCTDSSEQKQAVCWYSISGGKIDRGNMHFVNWTNVLNFLNPGNESLRELWGNGDGTLAKGLERFALVGWPGSADIAHAVYLFGALPSVPIILSHAFISVATLQFLLSSDRGQGKYCSFAHNLKTAEKNVDLLPLCRKLGTDIIESGDVKLADTFVKNCVTHLKEKEKALFLPWFATLVERFGWEDVSGAILSAIDVKSSETRLDRALELAEVFSDDPTARTDLVTFALGKTRLWNSTHADKFAASGKLIALLNHAMACKSAKVFLNLSALLKKVGGGLLRPVIDTLSDCVSDANLSEIRSALASIAAKRREWLIEEVEESKKPFAWEISAMNFPDSAQIVQFLQGPDVAFKTCGFFGIGDARARAKLLRQKIKGALTFQADGRGLDAFVQITKTGGAFDTRRKEVSKYQAEIDCLEQLVSDLLPQDEDTDTANVSTSAVGRKRLREDESNDIVVE